jgi:glycosyltransferase involved in cell wall biosynthesis
VKLGSTILTGSRFLVRPRPTHESHCSLVSKPLGPPWSDGSARLVAELVEALARSEGAPALEVFGRAGYQPPAGVRVRRSERRGLAGNLTMAAAVARDRESPIQHFFFAPHRAAVAVTALAARLAGAVAVQTICSRPRRFDEARALCFGRVVIALSRWTADRLLAAGVEARRLRVIPPPLPLPPLPDEATLRARRRELGFDEEAAIVVFPGDAERGGGLRSFVEAIRLLAPSRVGVGGLRFVIACRAKTPIAAQELARARRRLERRGLGEAVRFLGEVDRFPELLAACQLCALPAATLYAKVDYPYALLEAMSAGVPLVVGRGTAASELVEGGEGLLCPPGSPRALAAVFADLERDPAAWSARGARARSFVAERCDPAAIAAQHVEVYEGV